MTTTSYTDSNLNPQTSYSYNVRAFDGATPPNESGLSGAVTATTPAAPVGDITPPTVPANLTGSALSTTQIRLSWTASTDAGIGVAGYYVYRDGATIPTATVSGATTYTDSGLTANTGYSYTLRAFDFDLIFGRLQLAFFRFEDFFPRFGFFGLRHFTGAAGFTADMALWTRAMLLSFSYGIQSPASSR